MASVRIFCVGFIGARGLSFTPTMMCPTPGSLPTSGPTTTAPSVSAQTVPSPAISAQIADTLQRKWDTLDAAHDAPKDYENDTSPRVELNDVAGLRNALKTRGHAILTDVPVTKIDEAEIDTLIDAMETYTEVGPEMAIGKLDFTTATFLEHRFRNGRLEPHCGKFEEIGHRLLTTARTIVHGIDPNLLPYADDPCGQQDVFSTAVFRLLRFEAGSRSVLYSHTDASFVTLVPKTTVPGLLVYDPSLEVWVQPNDGVVVLAGEYIDICTGGEFPATVHRVWPAERRYSTPLLLRANHRGPSFDGLPMHYIWQALKLEDPREAKAFIDDKMSESIRL